MISFMAGGQIITWESRLPGLQPNAAILAAGKTSNTEIVALGSRDNGGLLEFIKFDSSGTLIYREPFLPDIFSTGYFFEMLEVPKEKDRYYVVGSGWDSTGIEVDFVCKIDSGGFLWWDQRKWYPGFHQTTRGSETLADKSIYTTGFASRPSTGWDVMVQKIDSNGVQLWERFYPLPGSQEALDIVEMLDGSLMVYIDDGAQNRILRINFDGEVIYLSSPFPHFPGNIDIAHGSIACTPENKLLVSADSWNGTWYDNEVFLITQDHFMESRETGNDAFRETIRMNEDNTYYLDHYIGFDSDTTQFNNYGMVDSLIGGVTFTVDGDLRFIRDFVSINGNDGILVGGIFDGNSSDYYLARIDGLADEWVPDHCSFSPPQAGFKWSYEGGILACIDTSFAGLKYHDSVYHYTWSGSNGFGSDSSSFYSVWDTSLQSSIDITLIIENFYRCKDTVKVTLSKSVLGIGAQVHDELKLSLYPNPADSYLIIELGSSPGSDLSGIIKLMDVNGHEVLRDRIQSSGQRMDISHLAGGVYFLGAELKGERVYRKIVKN